MQLRKFLTFDLSNDLKKPSHVQLFPSFLANLDLPHPGFHHTRSSLRPCRRFACKAAVHNIVINVVQHATVLLSAALALFRRRITVSGASDIDQCSRFGETRNRGVCVCVCGGGVMPFSHCVGFLHAASFSHCTGPVRLGLAQCPWRDTSTGQIPSVK